MFAWKSMDRNSNLLKLKLDMVYRDLPSAEAETKYAEIVSPDLPDVPVVVAKKPRRKVVKPILPKST